ncbi:MAG: hypothetical protein ABSF82_12915 [Candidatus Bathyarchaeia archaeon]|jgi:hypothetical protein
MNLAIQPYYASMIGVKFCEFLKRHESMAAGMIELKVYFCAVKTREMLDEAFDVELEQIVGRLKVEACEKLDLNPRITTIIRASEQFGKRMRWTVDPALSFKNNDIQNNDRLFLYLTPGLAKTCPVCLKTNEPVKDVPAFDAVVQRYCCSSCGWHWEVTAPDLPWHRGISVVEDETAYVTVRAPQLGAIRHFRMPTTTRVGNVVHELLKDHTPQQRGGERFELWNSDRLLEPSKSLSEQGIHYSTSLDLRSSNLK